MDGRSVDVEVDYNQIRDRWRASYARRRERFKAIAEEREIYLKKKLEEKNKNMVTLEFDFDAPLDDVKLKSVPAQLIERLKYYEDRIKEEVLGMKGDAATEQSEIIEVGYDREIEEMALRKSRYEEDVYINNHRAVWGSWWKDHQWGYKCCKQFDSNSYCTAAAGIEAAADLMKASEEASEDVIAPTKEKQ